MNRKRLDILLVGDNCLDTVGGEQESTKIIINGTKDKYSIGVIQPGKVKNRKSGVNYFDLCDHTRLKNLIKHPIEFAKYIYKIRKIIKFYQPKIIHTQAQVSFFIVALLKKIRLIPKDTYIIHTERGLFTKYNPFIKSVFYFFIKEVNTLVTTTDFNMKYWKFALEKRNSTLTYNIIENTAGELFEDFDEVLEKKEYDRITVGFAGRYTNWKNWPLAVEITEALYEELGDRLEVKMAIGCLDNKALVKTQAIFTELENRLKDRFDGRINIDLNEMNNFYYDIDVFILTSNINTESFGRTLVEAMSRKTVVLTTDAGGAVEVVGNTKNVLRTSDEFTDRVVGLFFNQDQMIEEKENNYVRVKQNYSLSNNISKHIELYDKHI